MRTRTSTLKSRLRPGKVFRRQELEPYSSNLNRDLQALVESGALKKAFYGIYYCPQQSRFGELPPDDHALIRAFLKTDDYLAFSPDELNGLGLGSTQLYNTLRVYNHKRHGVFTIAGKTYDFRLRPYFPKTLTEEFLFVEFLNERPHFAEEVPLRPDRLQQKIQQLNKVRLERMIKQFGKIYTQKIYAAINSVPTAPVSTQSSRLLSTT